MANFLRGEMVVHAWQGMIVVLTALSLVMGCASSPYVGTGAALGGGLGALTGAAINNRNPWAGALVGGLVGTGLGAVGGYVVQQRQASQPPPQGYYYPPRPGYSTPPAPGYGYGTPPAGPAYGYGSPPPPAYQYSEEAPPSQSSGCRTPLKTVPYYN